MTNLNTNIDEFFDKLAKDLVLVESAILKDVNLQPSKFTGTIKPLAGIYMWQVDQLENKEMYAKTLDKIQTDFIKSIKRHNPSAISELQFMTFIKPEIFSVGVSVVMYVNNVTRIVGV